ncbi:MAG: heme ABC exporter ATP-binding protein CcmA [Anaerolineae bacterium]
MIEIHRLVKAFGQRVVLRGVDLHLEPGEFVTLMGANGAGKTTLMHILATLSKATGGVVKFGGVDLAANPAHIRRYIGLVSHKTLLYDDLSALENLRFYARMYDVAHASERIETMLKKVGLWGRQYDPVRTYSRGMQQRLAIARAILHDPPILLLDEPDTGLDQHATSMLGDLLRSVEVNQRTVLMTTHNLERGLELGQRVVILAKGKIRYDARREDIDAATLREEYYRLVN